MTPGLKPFTVLYMFSSSYFTLHPSLYFVPSLYPALSKGLEFPGMGWYGMEWNGIEEMGWDGMGWDGMDGVGWDGME